MDSAYAYTIYPYSFSGLENPPYTLMAMSSAEVAVWVSHKLVLEESIAKEQSRKCPIVVSTIPLGPSMRATFGSSDLHPAALNSSDSVRGAECVSNTVL